MTRGQVAVAALVVVLCGIFAPPLVQPDFWTRIVDLSAVTRWHLSIAIAGLTCLVLLTYAAFSPPRQEQPWEKLERRAAIMTGLVTTVTLAFFVIVYFVLEQIADDGSKRADLIAILATGSAATVAILVQVSLENRRQRRERGDAERLRRRDFTHKAIQEFRTDQEVQKHRVNLRHEFPDLEKITAERLPLLYVSQLDPASYEMEGSATIKEPVLDSINALLAFYEQLAADIHEDAENDTIGGSVDEDLLIETLAPIIENLFQKALIYIHLMWRYDHEVYEHLRWLINRWGLLKDEEARVAHAVRQWSARVWSEEGAEKRLEHGSEGQGPWGRRALMEMAIRGLADWDPARPADRLVEKIRNMWGAEDGFEEACIRRLGMTLDDWVRTRGTRSRPGVTIWYV